jgi:hypothetical protein
MAEFLGVPLEAACLIGFAGAIESHGATMLGPSATATIGKAIRSGRTDAVSDIPIGRYACLAISPDAMYITEASITGKPKGAVLLHVGLDQIASVELDHASLSVLADVTLRDGRHAVFESGNRGMNSTNPAVYQYLVDRVGGP